MSIAIVRKTQLQKIQRSVWSLLSKDVAKTPQASGRRPQSVRHQAKACGSGAKSHATGDGQGLINLTIEDMIGRSFSQGSGSCSW
jgi:hypothetical protein